MTETLFNLSQGVNIGQHAEYFTLELADGSLLECQEIVRRVPGKRLVCRGLWDGRMVFAKVFIGDGASRYADRDAKGVKAIARGGLLTPELLYTGNTVDGTAMGEMARVLLFQAIEDGVNAEEIWQSMPAHSPARYSLALALVGVVANHHQAGLLQTDLYLKNFLVLKNASAEKSIYTLDGDGIRNPPNGLSRKIALNNLAQLFSKFDALDDAWIPELALHYAKQSEQSLSASDIARLSTNAMRIRRHAARRYTNKIFRSCTDVDVQQDSRRFVAVERPYFDSATLMLQHPEQLFDEHAVRLKSGNTCTVSLVTASYGKVNHGTASYGVLTQGTENHHPVIQGTANHSAGTQNHSAVTDGTQNQVEPDDLKVVVKRYNVKSFWHGLKRMIRRSRAAISWSNAHLLTIYGIATAAPIALYEKRLGPLRRESYFLAEYVDAPDVAGYFADAKYDQARKEMAAHNIAQLFFKLQLLMIAHGDFKASNMKIVADSTDMHTPVLIDLDSLKQYQCKVLFERRHVRDIKRLFRNWHDDGVIKALLKKAFQQVYLEFAGNEHVANTSNARLLQSAGLID